MRRSLIAAFLLLASVVTAQDVAEEELRELGTRDIEFINYSGPYDRIDTVDQIVGIGRALGASIDVERGFSDFVYVSSYRVIHAIDPDTRVGFDADIIVPLAASRIDHINNLRRIISGFLQEAYEYSQADADLLARWITVYNAVVRGNMEFFTTRYKPVVTGHLTADLAGLSRRYDEWPGRSRIVIPLTSAAAPGVIGTVDPREIMDDIVVEELRTLEDRALDERREMVNFVERVIEEREEAIERDVAAIDREERRIVAEEQRVIAEREEIARVADELSDEEIARREAELEARERELAAERRAIEERREAILDDREEVVALIDHVRAERERIARDARALLDEREISDEVRGLSGALTPVRFLRVREQGDLVLGQLVQINPITGLLLNRSREDRILSRRITFHADRLLVVVLSGETGRLVHFDVTTLAEAARGEHEIFPGSSLEIHGDPARVYAVVRADGGWHLGRFDERLELIGRSVLAVNPYTSIAFGGDRVWIQSADDRIVALSLQDLRISP